MESKNKELLAEIEHLKKETEELRLRRGMHDFRTNFRSSSVLVSADTFPTEIFQEVCLSVEELKS